MDLHLDRTVTIVTGGSAGVGLATARRVLAEGAAVAICGRDPHRLKETTEALEADNAGRVLGVCADVRDRGQVERLVDQTVERFGRLDGVVNNAGGSRMTTFATTSDEDWRDELDLKFSPIINTVRAALPHLQRSDRAAIVNVNAILARQPEPRLVATSAARAGLLNLSRSLATELAPIRVNSVCLGLIDTGQWRRRYDASDTDLSYEDWCRELAEDRGAVLGRVGTPDEVASMIVVLLSPVAAFVTGATLDVGGGVGRYV